MLNEHSRSHQKIVHGFKVLMAKNYLDDLSEEVTMGMLENAKGGDFPATTPAGYVRFDHSKSLRTKVIDINPTL